MLHKNLTLAEWRFNTELELRECPFITLLHTAGGRESSANTVSTLLRQEFVFLW